MKAGELIEKLSGIDPDARVHLGGMSEAGDEPRLDSVLVRGFGGSAELVLYADGVKSIEDTKAYKRAMREIRDDTDALEHEVESLEKTVGRRDAEVQRLKAENEKLRGLVYDAYAEGEQDARTGEGGWNESATKSDMERLEGRSE